MRVLSIVLLAALGLSACSMFGGKQKETSPPDASVIPSRNWDLPAFSQSSGSAGSKRDAGFGDGSLRREAAAYERLQSLYWPIASAASAYCTDQGIPSIGSVPTSEYDYSMAQREEAKRVLGVDARPRFTEVFANTPAGRAGIQVGDVLLTVGRQQVQGGESLARIWSEELSGAQRANAGVRLSLERNGRNVDAIVRPERHCTAGIFPVLGSGNGSGPQGIPKTILFPLSIIEGLEDTAMRGAIAWRVGEVALAAQRGRSPTIQEIDELAGMLLILNGETSDALWAVRARDAGQSRSVWDQGSRLGLPGQAMDPSSQARLSARLTDFRSTRGRDTRANSATPPAINFSANTAPAIVSSSPMTNAPRVNSAGQAAFKRFAERPAPKAFVVSQDGRWASAWGRSDALEHALEVCRREGGTGCKAFAINDRMLGVR